MSLPIVVTHPSMLFHNGLRQLLVKSSFRPVRISTSLTEDLEKYLENLRGGVWLAGVGQCAATTNELLRKVLSANPGLKAVILAPAHKPEDVIAALRAGASGFLSQDVPGETLLRSLELIAHGEMIVHPQFAWDAPAEEQRVTNGHSHDSVACIAARGSHLVPQQKTQSSLAAAAEMPSEDATTSVPSLSRREMLILRMLMQGASNKAIARNMVITESTVKVHMKAILRKLRLQNRTQAAIWARNHVNEADWNKRAGTDSAH